jgi:hypothetical protein
MVDIGFSPSVVDFYSMRWVDPTKTIAGLGINVQGLPSSKEIWGESWGRKPLGGAF